MKGARPSRRAQTGHRRRRLVASAPTTATGPSGARINSAIAPERRRVPAGRGWLYGRHAVAAALANPERRWRRLAILAGQEGEAAALVAGARAMRRGSGEAVCVLDHQEFAAVLPETAVHQGLALEVEPLPGRGLARGVRA